MSSAQERAKALAEALKQAVQEAKAAEARAKQLSEELVHVLAETRAEAQQARTIVEYPSGRYECAACRHSTIFTDATRELPACQNCGHCKWTGHEPTVIHIEPPPPRRYPAGMYECARCRVRVGVVFDSDDLSPCEHCGATELTPLEV